jgi:hypothetical protein
MVAWSQVSRDDVSRAIQDFEGGKAGAVTVLGKLGFTILPLQQ